MKANISHANLRLVVMLLLNFILFLVMLKFAVWSSVEREIRLVNLVAMISTIPLVLCIPVVAGGKVWQQLVGLMLAVYPALIFWDAVSDMLKYVANK